MTRRRDIPAELPEIFAVRQALELGVTARRLDAADLTSPFHGTRVPATEPHILETRCRALATRFRPGDAFAGPTAARIWGMPLPSSHDRSTSLHVSSRLPTRSFRRRGVVGSSRTSPDPTVQRGLPVLPVWSTVLHLAPMLGVDDLTAVIDFVLTGASRRNPLSSSADLDEFLDEHAHRPGMSTLRRARADSRPGAWSRPETLLRLALMRGGIPDAELNLVLAHPSGRTIIPDLAWPEYRVAAEYNGAHHDLPRQRLHDLRRIDDFTDLGWTTVNIEKVELFRHPASVIRRVSARLAAAGWTPPHSGRLPKGPSGGTS